MATYEEIYGKRVDVLDADPTLNSSYEGQVWYNSTSGTLKSVVGIAAWASSSSISQAREKPGAFGTQTASVISGGFGGGSTNYDDTEEFNGSGWTAGGNLNTAREGLGGVGILTAGLAAGGFDQPSTYKDSAEEYNGTAWTNVTAAPYAWENGGAFGIQTAAVFAGGAPGNKDTSLEYDGSSWTTGGQMNDGRGQLGAAGQSTLTAGLIFGGVGMSAKTEEYDGSSWTTGGDLPAATSFLGGAGTQTAGLSFGGFTGPTTLVTTTSNYDGTSWAVSPATLATAQGRNPGSGSNTAALIGGGSYPSTTIVATTQEFNFEINTITASAWASSPALSYNVNSDIASAGSVTSAVAAGGYNAPAGPGTVSYIANAASWNGTAWTNITDMPERRVNANSVGATAPAYYVYGGANQPPSPGTAASYLTTTHTWNGSAWGSGAALAEGQSDGGGAGTPSAIVLLGGVAPPGTISNNIQEYNGSSWSNNPVNMPTSMSSCAATGTQTAAVVMGGYQGASPFPSAGVTNSYEWDGSSVSAGGDLCFGLLGTAGSGPQTAAFLYGGRNTGGNKEAICMTYNGTAWSTAPSLGTGRDYIGRGPNGSQTSALAVAGSCPSQSLVEEFTSETSTITASTLTTS